MSVRDWLDSVKWSFWTGQVLSGIDWLGSFKRSFCTLLDYIKWSFSTGKFLVNGHFRRFRFCQKHSFQTGQVLSEEFVLDCSVKHLFQTGYVLSNDRSTLVTFCQMIALHWLSSVLNVSGEVLSGMLQIGYVQTGQVLNVHSRLVGFPKCAFQTGQVH